MYKKVTSKKKQKTMRYFLLSGLLCFGTALYAQIDVPCRIFDDGEHAVGFGVSKEHTDADMGKALRLAKQDALSEALIDFAKKSDRALKNVAASSTQESGNETSSQLKSGAYYTSTDTFDLDNFRVACVKTKQTSNGAVAYIAVRAPQNALQNAPQRKIRNLMVAKMVKSVYADRDASKKFSDDGKSGLNIELYYQEQATTEEVVRLSFNLSGMEKFHAMAAQEEN